MRASGCACSDEPNPLPQPQQSSPKGTWLCSPWLHLSDMRVAADLRLLVEEGQDVISRSPDQRGLVVHGGVRLGRWRAHVQVGSCRLSMNSPGSETRRRGVRGGTAGQTPS